MTIYDLNMDINFIDFFDWNDDYMDCQYYQGRIINCQENKSLNNNYILIKVFYAKILV